MSPGRDIGERNLASPPAGEEDDALSLKEARFLRPAKPASERAAPGEPSTSQGDAITAVTLLAPRPPRTRSGSFTNVGKEQPCSVWNQRRSSSLNADALATADAWNAAVRRSRCSWIDETPSGAPWGSVGWRGRRQRILFGLPSRTAA